MLDKVPLSRARFAVVSALLSALFLLGLAPAHAADLNNASISGKVSAPAGVEMNNVSVTVRDAENRGHWGQVHPDGSYKVSDLPAGSYKVQFSGHSGALERWYGGASTYESAKEVPVAAGQNVTGINTVLVKGATISGKVTAPIGFDPSRVSISVRSADGMSYAGNEYADTAGNFKIIGLKAGTYKILFSSFGAGTMDQWYGGAATFEAAQTLTLAASQDLVGINAILFKGASISGKVAAPAGVDLSEVRIAVVAATGSGVHVGYGAATDSGDYSIKGLPAGTYKVQFYANNTGALDQWYAGADSHNAARPLALTADQDLAGIDVTLRLGATVSGKVTAPAGIDPSTVNVLVQATDRSRSYYARAGADGSYSVQGIPAGFYKVHFSGHGSGAIEQWYAGVSSFDAAKTLTLKAGQNLDGINALLVKGATVSGKVAAPAGVNLSSVQVTIRGAVDGFYAGIVTADNAGNYKVAGLPAGRYKVEFSAYNTGALSQWYSGADSFENARVLTLKEGQDISNINGTLPKGATISGRITAPVGVDLSNVHISVIPAAADTYGGFGTADKGGNYSVTGLRAGTYKIVFLPYNTNAANQWYGGASTFDAARAVTVKAGENRSGIDVTLIKGATISGKITVPAGIDVTAVSVSAIPSTDRFSFGFALVAANGTYSIKGLTAGSYKVQFSALNTGVLTQWYGGAGTFEEAQSISVGAGQLRSGLNASLIKGASISGKITAPEGSDLHSSRILAIRDGSTDAVGSTSPVSADGSYSIIGLPAGSYKVKFEGGESGVTDTWYGGSTSAARKILLATSEVRTGVNLRTATGETISGKVSGAHSGGYPVAVLNASGKPVKDGYSAPDGTFSIVGLAAGSYKVAFNRSSGFSQEEAQFYNNKPESAGPEQAQLITIASGKPATKINASLVAGGSIAGVATDRDGKPLARSHVQAYTPDGSLVTRSAVTDAAGKYTISGLTTGKYILVLHGTLWQKDKLYSGNTSTEADATPISVAVGKTSTLNLKSGSAASALTAPVPKITGTAKVGSTLTAVPGTWGPAPVTLTYRWYADGVAIANATASTYKPTSTRVGKTITVTVTGTKTGYTTAAKTSAPTAKVIAPVPALTAPVPKITGTAKVGSTLTAVPGTWGPAPVTLTYRWYADGVAIANATASTYKPTSTRVGKTITVTVTGTKTGYTTAAKTSAPTAKVL